MTIVDFIAEDMRRFGTSPVGRKSRDRWKRLRENVEGFAAAQGRQPELLDLVNPFFVYDFCAWLYDEKGKGCDPITVFNWVDVFGRMTRNAIRYGYIPNIDVTRNIHDALAREHGVEQVPEADVRRQCEVKSVDFRKEFELLLRTLAKLDKDQEGSFDSLTRQALLYVTGVTLGGLSYGELAQVEWRWVKGQIKIYIPRYDRLVDFQGIPKIMWQWYSDPHDLHPENGQKLFPDLRPEWEYQFRTDVAAFLAQNHIQLFKAQNTLYDFLAVVHAYGISDADIIDFVKLRQFNDPRGYYGQLVGKFLLTDFDPRAVLQAQWRVLRITNPKVKIENVSEAISKLARDITLRGMDCRIEQIVPYQEVNPKSMGRQLRSTEPFFSSCIFVRCLLPEAELIERALPAATFLRDLSPEDTHEDLPEDDSQRKMRSVLSMVTLTTASIHRLRDHRSTQPPPLPPSLATFFNQESVPA